MSDITTGTWIAKDGTVVQQETRNIIAITVYRNEREKGDAVYDAELMAASKDLLSALRACYDHIMEDEDNTNSSVIIQCKEALSKAGFPIISQTTQSADDDWLPF